MTNVRLCYQTVEFGKTDIHLCTLRSKQEYSDPEGVAEKIGICSASWPIFGVIWPTLLKCLKVCAWWGNTLNNFRQITSKILNLYINVPLPKNI